MSKHHDRNKKKKAHRAKQKQRRETIRILNSCINYVEENNTVYADQYALLVRLGHTAPREKEKESAKQIISDYCKEKFPSSEIVFK